MGQAIFSDGGTRVVDGQTLAGWCVISRSPHGRTDVMFGPVITTEAHLAFSGARAHSNNTAEMTAILKHCLSLVLIVQWPRMSSRVFIMIFSLLLVYAWARSRLVRMCSWHACQRSMIFAQRKLRLTMQHVYGHSTVEIWGNEYADHAAALGDLRPHL